MVNSGQNKGIIPCFGGEIVNLLGSRLRHRRRRMRLQQKDVAAQNSASFLSKVETGAAYPSLQTLHDWAKALATTPGDLLGDNLVLEAAKYTILLTNKCHAYLDLLPATTVTRFLRELSTSATSLSTAVPTPPEDPELQFLTAQVLDHRGATIQAASLLEAGLIKWHSPLWCIYYLSLLCQVYDKLSETTKKKQAKKELRAHISKLDPKQVLYSLPQGANLTHGELQLLQLCILFKPLLETIT